MHWHRTKLIGLKFEKYSLKRIFLKISYIRWQQRYSVVTASFRKIPEVGIKVEEMWHPHLYIKILPSSFYFTVSSNHAVCHIVCKLQTWRQSINDKCSFDRTTIWRSALFYTGSDEISLCNDFNILQSKCFPVIKTLWLCTGP